MLGRHLLLPDDLAASGVTFDTSQQIRCGYDGSGGAAPQGNCPGWGNLSGGSYYNNQDSGLWGVAQGHHWEFQFPVKATQPLSGATLQIAVKTIDGNNDATLNLQAPIYVFGPGGTGSRARRTRCSTTPRRR